MQRPQETQSTIPDDAVLFDRYGSIIFAYIRVHTLNSEDAEDLALEVFIAAYERDNLSSLGNGSEQLAWLKRVAHNIRNSTLFQKMKYKKLKIDLV